MKTRNVQPEWMDQPDLPPDQHRQALMGLGRIHYASRTVGALWQAVKRMVPAGSTIADVACGGGDVLLGLVAQAKRSGISLQAVGYDISRTALDVARRRAQAMRLPAQFRQQDVVQAGIPEPADVVICTLFLHHLTDADAVRLLQNMNQSARRLWLVSDLRRCWQGMWAARLACRLLSRSPIVHVDGPRSVAAAFSIEEARQLCAKAGIANAQVNRQWPFRYLMVAESSRHSTLTVSSNDR